MKKESSMDLESATIVDTPDSEKMVTIRFKHPMKNLKITEGQLELARKAYEDQVIARYGVLKDVPYMQQAIMDKVQIMFGEPYVFLIGIDYKMTEKDAAPYLEKYRLGFEDNRQIYLQNVEKDLTKYQIKHYMAELVE